MDSINKQDSEDVLTVLSVTGDYDISREEEKTLLDIEEDMSVDTSQSSIKQKIVFDLNDSQDEDYVDNRSNFFSERNEVMTKTQSNTDIRSGRISLNAIEFKREIPESLSSVKTNFTKSKRRRNRRNRGNSFSQTNVNNGKQDFDLRSLIQSQSGSAANRVNKRSLSNRLRLNPNAINNAIDLIQLNSLLNLQSLLNNTDNIANQIMNNPLIGRLGFAENSLLNKIKSDSFEERDKIEVTIINSPQQPMTDSSRVKTVPKIKCLIDNENSDDSQSGDSRTRQVVPQLKTKFAKHLFNKRNQSISETPKPGSNAPLVKTVSDVDIDDNYIEQMEENKRKRDEVQRLKEQRRLESADERLEIANELSIKLKNKGFRPPNARITPY